MIGKRVQIDDEMWNALNLLRQERCRSFQQLAEEALRDLLAKYDKPIKLKDQLKESAKVSMPPSIAPIEKIARKPRHMPKVKARE